MTKTKTPPFTAHHLAIAIRDMPVFSILTFGTRLMLEYTLECHPEDAQEALARARRLSSVPTSDYLDVIDRVEQRARQLAAA